VLFAVAELLVIITVITVNISNATFSSFLIFWRISSSIALATSNNAAKLPERSQGVGGWFEVRPSLYG